MALFVDSLSYASPVACAGAEGGSSAPETADAHPRVYYAADEGADEGVDAGSDDSSGAVESPAAHIDDIEIPFPADWRAASGEAAGDRCVRLRAVGPRDAPAVLVLGGISAGRRAAATGKPDDETPGWWADIVAPGGGVDTDRFRVFSADFFPLAPEAALDLQPADYARAFLHALREAGVARLDAVVGASFGGMVAQEMAARAPDYIGRLAVLCASHRPSVMGRAWRRVQRRILELGLAAGAPEEAVKVARELAITTYRTTEEFDERFAAPGEVESYLAHHGEKFAASMSAPRYLTLSAAIDAHAGEPSAISAPTLVIGSDKDHLAPLADVREFAASLPRLVDLVVLNSKYGHDAFLKEAAAIAPRLKEFLEEKKI